MKDHRSYNNIRSAGLFIVLALVFTSCSRNENSTGYVYAPDMAYSLAYETYTPNPVTKNGITMLNPVAGTVPRGIIPYRYPRTFDGQVLAGKELVNPLELTESNLTRGKVQYDLFCAICHGEKGAGDGFLFTSKKFTAMPRILNDSFVQEKPDGEIYHVITLGSLSGLMGAHGSQIKPDDRWRITHYIKNDFSVTVQIK